MSGKKEIELSELRCSFCEGALLICAPTSSEQNLPRFRCHDCHVAFDVSNPSYLKIRSRYNNNVVSRQIIGKFNNAVIERENEEWEDVNHVADFLADIFNECKRNIAKIEKLFDKVEHEGETEENFEAMKKLYDELDNN